MKIKTNIYSKANSKQTPTIDQWIKQNLVLNSNGNWYLMLNQNGQKINTSSSIVPSNKPWGSQDTNSVVTTWSGLCININTFLVNNGDYTNASSQGLCSHYPITDRVPFGTAFDCAGNYSATGLAQIDLTGTNWFIDDSWAIGGWLPGGSAVLSSNNQIASISGGGYCGYNAPVKATTETMAYTGGPYIKLKLQCRPGDIAIGTDCYALWAGAPSLANGMQFLIKSFYIYDSSTGNNDSYSYYLGQSKNGRNGSSGNPASYVCASADTNDALNTSTTPNSYNIFVANNVVGTKALYTFLQSGKEVYWNSLGICSTQPSSQMIISLNGNISALYTQNSGCSSTYRSYMSTDNLQLKADTTIYTNQTQYYFNLFYKYN